MRGRILCAALLAALLLPGAAVASEGSQAKAVGAALRPFAGTVPDLDQQVADTVSDGGDATVARCGPAADAITALPARRRTSLVSGLALLQVGLDTLPGAVAVLLGPLQASQDELQVLALRAPVLKTARAARRRNVKLLATLAPRRESLCPLLEPWAQAGFTTDRANPAYRRIRRATRRAAATIEDFDRAFDGQDDPRRVAGAAALRRAGVSQRVAEALTLDFDLPKTSGAIVDEQLRARLRRADRAGRP